MDEPIDNGSDGAIHNPHQERLPAPVYYISSPDDKSVMVGIDVRLLIYEPGRAKILWDDPFYPNNPRVRWFTAARKNDEAFEFREAESNNTYCFEPMTLDIYNETVRYKLMNGRDFDSIEEPIDTLRAIDPDW